MGSLVGIEATGVSYPSGLGRIKKVGMSIINLKLTVFPIKRFSRMCSILSPLNCSKLLLLMLM